MKKGKRLTTLQRIVRFVGWMFLGSMVGRLIGAGFGSGFLKTDMLSSEQEPFLLWGIRGVVIVLFIISILYLLKTHNIYTAYQTMEEDENDEQVDDSLKTMFLSLERAILFSNIASILVLFNVLLGFRITFSSNDAELSFPLLDSILLLLVLIVQAFSNKTIQKVRNYKLSAFPTVSELKDYIYSLDEGEMQLNVEQAYMTVFNLNQRIIPALYVIIFLISLWTQTNQFLAYIVLVVVHLYINIMEYMAARRYFK